MNDQIARQNGVINSVITTANTTYSASPPPSHLQSHVFCLFSPLLVPSCHHGQWQENDKSWQIIFLLPYWCGRGYCLVAVTIFVNLSFQPVVFLLWILMTFKIYLEFEENVWFRIKKKNSWEINFGGCLNADVGILAKYRGWSWNHGSL